MMAGITRRAALAAAGAAVAAAALPASPLASSAAPAGPTPPPAGCKGGPLVEEIMFDGPGAFDPTYVQPPYLPVRPLSEAEDLALRRFWTISARLDALRGWFPDRLAPELAVVTGPTPRADAAVAAGYACYNMPRGDAASATALEIACDELELAVTELEQLTSGETA